MRQYMIRVALLASVSCGFCAGCARFSQSEMDLTAQARKGIALIAQNDVQRGSALSELAKLRRARLDEAFDADVRERATTQPLESEWVIEARKAYEIALDADAKTQAANNAALERRKELLADIDAALERLQWMQSIRLQFDSTVEPLTKSLTKGGAK